MKVLRLCQVLLVTRWALPSVEAFTVRYCISFQQRSPITHDKSSPQQSLLNFHDLTTTNNVCLGMSFSPDEGKRDKPFFLDPGTKGGALFYMFALFVVPYLVYQVLVASGMDEIQTGIVIGVGFTILSTLIWSSTYLFRVATKDMTYVSPVDCDSRSHTYWKWLITTTFSGQTAQRLWERRDCKATGGAGWRWSRSVGGRSE